MYAAEPTARQLYKQGRKAEKEKDFARAYLLYAEAAAKDSSHKEYWNRSEALRTRAATAANVMPVFSEGSESSSSEEGEAKVEAATPKEVEDARKPQPPFELNAAAGRYDFDLRGDAQTVFNQVAKKFGLDVIMDGDYQTGPTIRFHMTEADYREALYGLMTATGVLYRPYQQSCLHGGEGHGAEAARG